VQEVEQVRKTLSAAYNFHFNPKSDLGFNLAGVTREEGEEALGAGVDDVNLVEGDCVDHLLTLLQLALRALHEPGARACAKHILANTNKRLAALVYLCRIC
jgi:hypothetical protein